MHVALDAACSCFASASLSTMVEPRTTPRTSITSSRLSRFSRSAFALSTKVERPPLVLQWSSTIIRVGLAEQASPQHYIPINISASSAMKEEEDWYYIIAPIVEKVYDAIMLDPSSRRVVCVTSSLIMPRAWEDAFKKIMFDLGVPFIVFQNNLETTPLAMGWNRGLVVSVGREEAQCIVIANGASLHYTYQAVPCGYDSIVDEHLKDKLELEWTRKMNMQWLDETNPNSLMTALLKCLSSCPRDLKRDVISNIVFIGDAIVFVPDLPRQVRNRLVGILQNTAESFDNDEEEPVATSDSSLTMVPTDCASLVPLASSVAATSTAPLRPDLVSWVGASLWATVWHRHEEQVQADWQFPPSNDNDDA